MPPTVGPLVGEIAVIVGSARAVKMGPDTKSTPLAAIATVRLAGAC